MSPNGNGAGSDTEFTRIPEPVRTTEPAPVLEDRRWRQASQDPHCALSVGRKHPVAVLARVQGSGLGGLLAPEHRIGAQSALTLKGHGPFVEGAEEDEVAEDLKRVRCAEV